jgi:FkbM family methyltransferase
MIKPRWLKSRVARCLLATGGLVSWWTGNRFKKYGVWIDVSSHVVHPQTRAALFWGLYESSERRAVRKFLPVGVPVVELGASIGFITTQIADQLRGERQVALEANPEILPVLNSNISLNGNHHVTVVSGAIHYGATEHCRMYLAERTDGSRVMGDDTAQGRMEEVRALTLKQLLTEQGIEDFALVADIEGAEYEVITREGEDTQSRCHLAIMELHEVRRDGRTWTREDLARLFCQEWKMDVSFSDGKVWVFRPRQPQTQ